MTDKTLISISAILVIGILCSIAMLKGIDGALYMSSLAVIGGIAGYQIKGLKNNITK